MQSSRRKSFLNLLPVQARAQERSSVCWQGENYPWPGAPTGQALIFIPAPCPCANNSGSFGSGLTIFWSSSADSWTRSRSLLSTTKMRPFGEEGQLCLRPTLAYLYPPPLPTLLLIPFPLIDTTLPCLDPTLQLIPLPIYLLNALTLHCPILPLPYIYATSTHTLLIPLPYSVLLLCYFYASSTQSVHALTLPCPTSPYPTSMPPLPILFII